MEWFYDLPQLLQFAVALGVALAVAFGGGSLIWVRFGGMAKKVDAHTAQIAQSDSRVEQIQTDFNEKLRLKELEFSKQIEAAQDAFAAKLEIEKKEFARQLETIASNFAQRQTEHNGLLEIKEKALKEETKLRVDAEVERDELKTTLANLNKRIEDVEGDLQKQKDEMHALQKTIEDKNKKEKELGDLLKAFKEQVATLSDEKQIWLAEKALVIEIMQALGVKLKAIEEKREKQTEEINAT